MINRTFHARGQCFMVFSRWIAATPLVPPKKTWMPATRAGMTSEGVRRRSQIDA